MLHIQDKLSRVDYEQYIEDPIDACMKVHKFRSDLLKKWKRDTTELRLGKLIEAKILWLEGE